MTTIQQQPSVVQQHDRNEAKKVPQLKPMKVVESFVIFITFGIALFIFTRWFIPIKAETLGCEPVVAWFIVGAFGIFIPMFILSAYMLHKEGYHYSQFQYICEERLRFKKMSKQDWCYTLIGLICVGILSGIIVQILESQHIKVEATFMKFEPLTPGRYWILLVWIPFFFCNIMGEEVFWRGVMMPRQELFFGRYTWFIHGFGWFLFHIAFGLPVLLTTIPILFIQPYITQKTKNSWPGVIIHATLNGPAFLAISFGLL